MAKKKTQKGYFAVLYVTVVCILAAAGIGAYSYMTREAIPVDEPTNSEKSSSEASLPPAEPAPEPEPAVATFLAVGDNLIHDGVYLYAKSASSDGSYDFSPIYRFVSDKISAADIASINQETVIDVDKPPSAYPMFNSPPEVGKEIVKIGFDVINLANNHIYDKGESGLRNTLDFWGGQPITYVGAYKNQEDFKSVRAVEKNSIIFGFIGMTELTNGLSIDEDSELFLLRTSDEESIKAQIERTKAKADVVVANVHWGVEYTHQPSQSQRNLAQKLADWGVDIIIGHHPHVIQPIEYIERADGTKAVAVYSLGNFVSTQQYGPRMLGGMVELSVIKAPDGAISYSAPKFTPLITHYNEQFKDIAIYPRELYTDELAKAHGCVPSSPEFGLSYIDETVKQVIDEQFLQ